MSEAFVVGYQAGMLSGEVLYSMYNQAFACIIDYQTGQTLSSVRNKLRGWFLEMQFNKCLMGRGQCIMFNLQAAVLQDGEKRLSEESIDGIPGMSEALGEKVKPDTTVTMLDDMFLIQKAVARPTYGSLVKHQMASTKSRVGLSTERGLKGLKVGAKLAESNRAATAASRRPRWRSNRSSNAGRRWP